MANYKVKATAEDGTELRGTITFLRFNELEVVLTSPEEFKGERKARHKMVISFPQPPEDKKYMYSEKGELTYRGERVARECLVEAYETALDRRKTEECEDCGGD